MARRRRAPLEGVKVIDLSALGPGPFASMILADFGADVLAVRRPDRQGPDPSRGLMRGKRELTVDLRKPAGVDLIRRLALRADVLLESFRPGVAERLGLGPEPLMSANAGLVYARLTGWGQTGPYALRAGHDINYLAVSGALGVSGLDMPIAPPALLGDLANGSYLAVIGILTALYERRISGEGRLIDAAIVDGAALMLSAIFGELESGDWPGTRGTHVLSGAAPFYGVYQCSDGAWFSVGAIEHKFYLNLLDLLGLVDVDRTPAAQWDREKWPALRARIVNLFSRRTRDDWAADFAAVDACGAPVLEVFELAQDPHLAARGTVVRTGSTLKAAAAPRLSGYDHIPAPAAPEPRSSSRSFLMDLGIEAHEIDGMIADETIEH
jgi:alpha-methylacyl-CoA racemase